jgi:hypothetical protein
MTAETPESTPLHLARDLRSAEDEHVMPHSRIREVANFVHDGPTALGLDVTSATASVPAPPAPEGQAAAARFDGTGHTVRVRTARRRLTELTGG